MISSGGHPDLLGQAGGDVPEIAVLMPHRNAERFLGAAVNSVLAQTFSDFQLIFVDDCSDSDAWRDVLRPFRADGRVKVFRTERNVGMFRIFNALLPAVRSPFVAFHDADDLSDGKRFAVELECMKAYGYEIVGCSFVRIDTDGRMIGERPMTFDGNARKSYTVQLAPHPSTIVSRRVFDAIGGFDERWVNADSEFHVRASHLFRIRNVPQCLYRYRVWGGQTTASPSTGRGTPARAAQQEEFLALERQRQSCASREELLRLLQPQSIGNPFALLPVTLG